MGEPVSHARSFSSLASESRLIASMARRMTAGGSPEDLLGFVAVQLAEHDQSTCVACLVSDDREWIHSVGFHDADRATRGASDDALPEPVRIDEGMVGQVITTGRPVLVERTEDAIATADRPEIRRYLRMRSLPSFMIAPLRTRSKIIGSIGMSRTRLDDRFDSADLEALVDIAAVVSLAVERALLIESFARQVRATRPGSRIGGGFTTRE